MKLREHQRAAWVLAFSLCFWGVAVRASAGLELEEEELSWSRAFLVQLDIDVQQGKRSAEDAERTSVAIAARVRDIEKALPILRHWADMGKADAVQDIARGKFRFYSIDPALFQEQLIEPYWDSSRSDWHRLLTHLTGVIVLPVQPHGSDLRLLNARVRGYNFEVAGFLRARHGQDIFERVKQEARRAHEARIRWSSTVEIAMLGAQCLAALASLFLFGRLIRMRKAREQQPSPVALT